MPGAVKVAAVSDCQTNAAWVGKVQERTAKRAGFKKTGEGKFCRTGLCTKISQVVAGSKGPSITAKARFEGSHYTQAAFLRKSFEHGGHSVIDGQLYVEADSIDAKGVRSRFYRQDNVRFRENLFHEKPGAGQGASKSSKAKLMQGLSSRARAGHRLSRWAHKAWGATELCAAPTGFTSNSVRNALLPRVGEKSLANALAMVAILPGVGIGLTSLFALMRGTRAGQVSVGSNALASVGLGSLGAFVFANTAFSALSGLASFTLSTASAAVMPQDELLEPQKQALVKDHANLLKRIDAFLCHTAQGTHGYDLAVMALNRKIGAQYREHNNSPKLLDALYRAHDPSLPEAVRLKNIAHTAGEYLSKPDLKERINEAGFVGKPFARFSAARQRTKLESHFVALCDLLEHAETLPSEKTDSEVDLRKGMEADIKKFGENHVGKGLDKSGAGRLWQKMTGQTKYSAHQAKVRSATGQDAGTLEHILSHSHQYGYFTRKLASSAEFCRRLALDISLARNLQLTRVALGGIRILAKPVLTGPISRIASYSLARFFGGATLTLLTVVAVHFTGGALHAASTSVAGALVGPHSTSVEIGQASLNLIAAAPLMTVLFALGSVSALGAMALSKYGGAYKGNFSKPVTKNPAKQPRAWDEMTSTR